MWQNPLEIYVAWEPKSDLGGELARSLLAWFTGDPGDPLSYGPAIGLSYRSVARDAQGLPPPVPWSRSRYSVLVALVDDAMVSRRDVWRDWLEQALAETENAPGERRLLLCGLTDNFTNLSRKLTGDQAIRLTQFGNDRASLVMELQARLTNEICRLCDPKRKDEQATSLFISHAKRDGRDAAVSLKKYIDDSPVGEVFFDETSLQPAKAFDSSFRKRLEKATLIILLTDCWASRYWCQWEALQGKELERPILLVDMLTKGERRHFPYLGNIPALRCEADSFDEAACRRVVAAAQLETLRDIHEELRMQALGVDGRLPEGARHLTRAPELATLATLLDPDEKTDDASEEDKGLDAAECYLVYPDPPIAQHEERLIHRYKASLRMATPIELLGGESDVILPAGRFVAVSISDSPNLSDLGYEQSHLDRLWIALARHLLALGAGLAYGGDLRKGGFTDHLRDLIGAYADEGRLLDERLVQWHVAWPISLQLTDEIRAELPDVIDLHTVGKPEDVEAANDVFVSPADNPYAWIRSLTEMRRQMVATTHARVLIGGQRKASTPRSGIVEEFALSLRAGQPIFLCGAMGGMSADLIEVLQEHAVPESMTDEFHADTDDRRRAMEEYNQTEAGAADPIDYSRLVEEFTAAGVSGLRNGLTREENERLFRTHSLEEIVGLVRRGLIACAEGRRSE